MKQKVAIRASLATIAAAANSNQANCIQFVEITNNVTNDVAAFINFKVILSIFTLIFDYFR